jgi:hypothetical protein
MMHNTFRGIMIGVFGTIIGGLGLWLITESLKDRAIVKAKIYGAYVSLPEGIFSYFSGLEEQNPNIPTNTKSAFSSFMTHNLKGVWRIELINTGKMKAENVKIDVPKGFYAGIKRAGDDIVYQKISGVFNIGDIFPSEKIRMNIWTDNQEPDWDLANDITIFYSQGVAIKEVFLPSGAFAHYFEKNWIIWLIGLIYLVPTIVYSRRLLKAFKAAYWILFSKIEKSAPPPK